VDTKKCDFRSVGVLVRENKILVQREKNGNEYALPGGNVQFGETSENALVRRYKAEIGADILCDRLIWVEELFWKWKNESAHGINFYYLISLKNDSDIADEPFDSCEDNHDVSFEWVAIEEIGNLVIYPNFIKEKIKNISGNIEHFINYCE